MARVSERSLPPADRDRLWSQLMAIAEYREPELGGWTRRVFSEPYRRSRDWVRQRMGEVGLGCRIDAAGNLLGERPGPGAGWIVLGSHTDTVAGGGRFDGMVGVMAGIEVARLLEESGVRLRHGLRVVDFLGEEPNRFGLSCLGSLAVAGHLSRQQLELRDQSGASLGEALAAIGVDPAGIDRARWRPDEILAYLELHIEQGPRLEVAGASLGVVSAIVGIHRAAITLTGRPDHAGTAPMELRRDALAAAAEVVLGLEGIARRPQAVGGEEWSGVGTVGSLTVGPNAANVIPGEVTMTAELRSAQAGWLRTRAAELERRAREVADVRGVGCRIDWVSSGGPVACAPELRAVLRRCASELEPSPLELVSGAGHDAVPVSSVAPVGMIFIPSRDGRSHCPEEWSEPEHVGLGTEALLRSVLALDRKN